MGFILVLILNSVYLHQLNYQQTSRLLSHLKLFDKSIRHKLLGVLNETLSATKKRKKATNYKIRNKTKS